MKILVVGLGSMGKRRVRNLQHLQAGELLGVDIRQDRREEAARRYRIPTCGTFTDGMEWNPDLIVISTPPDQHLSYALQAARAGKHFFTELNVVSDGLDELIDAVRTRPIVAAPSCTFRHHPALLMVKRLLDEGTIGAVRYFSYHSGQHVADWHPYEDYRDYYVSRRATGAGREMVPFELNWLTWLFGSVACVACVRARVGALDADIDDLHQCLLTFRRGARGAVTIDVVSRPPVRLARFDGSRGAVVWDAMEKVVRVWTDSSGWQEHPEPPSTVEGEYITAEGPYIAEMAALLSAVRGDLAYGYSFEDDREILRVLAAVERSADAGTFVTVDDFQPA